MPENEKVVPFFKTEAKEDPVASKAQGRPIFKDMEVVEIRIPGERNYAPVFPAQAVWKTIDNVPITYADRFRDAYERFSAGKDQVADGTPLSELPFLTEAKRAELRSLKVYTAEALVGLEGRHLKALGAQGRDIKTQAEAYLASARGVGEMVAELEVLKAEIAALKGEAVEPPADEQPTDADDEKESLKAMIADATGSRPRGNPSLETLREMVSDLTEVA